LQQLNQTFYKSDLAALFVSIFQNSRICNANLKILKTWQKGLIVAVLTRVNGVEGVSLW